MPGLMPLRPFFYAWRRPCLRQRLALPTQGLDHKRDKDLS